MFLVDLLILTSGVLLLLGIASSKISARLGVPVLVLFLLLGMIAGSEGIGRIAFDDFRLAHGIGTLALVFILFDGGLSTPMTSVRRVWKPALVLATLGVLVTAAITGLFASWILGLSLLEGFLLGSIVGSTDAAAVFAVLRNGGVSLTPKIGGTLEIESGSNDPMAIFLTVGCIQVLTNQVPLGPALISLFALQMGVGVAVGLGLGFLAVPVINRINLDAAGLYPVLVSAFALLTFGIAAWLGGSGFLAVYLAGIVIGNSTIVFQRGVLLFHDGIAWLSQILMFVVLGLLSFPSRLMTVAWEGMAVAVVLIFLARPVAVFGLLFPLRFSFRELLFLSWVGLKGAVPITLATFPLFFGVENAALIFNVVFFVVLLSAVVQGWSLPMVARGLGLEVPAEPGSPVTLEITSLRHVDGDIVDYTVGQKSKAAGKLIRHLSLPEGAVVALIARQHQIIPPHGDTRIQTGDHVTVVLNARARPLVNRVFSAAEDSKDALPVETEFPLRGSVTIGALEEAYDLKLNVPPELSLHEAIAQRLGDVPLYVGATVEFGPIALRVKKTNDHRQIEQVAMIIRPVAEDAAGL